MKPVKTLRNKLYSINIVPKELEITDGFTPSSAKMKSTVIKGEVIGVSKHSLPQ